MAEQNKLTETGMTRRDFLTLTAKGAAGALLSSSLPLLPKTYAQEISDNKRGLYMTSWTAQCWRPDTPGWRLREELVRLLTSTDLNAVVIDVVDTRPLFPESVREFVSILKKQGIWCIARVVVTQNNEFAHLYPGSILRRKSSGQPWSCQGVIGIDPASRTLWDYTVEMSQRAIDFNFDEIQYDYIRFPADCNAREARFPVWDGKKSRRQVMSEFFKYLTETVRAANPRTILSIDVFGDAILKEYSNKSKEEVGQFYEDMVNYFDVISPMVYPSHFIPNFRKIPVPAAEPYNAVYQSMKYFVSYLQANHVRAKVRPWLQYFSVSNFRTHKTVDYDECMILDQRRALDDLGITGFLYWDPSNKYNRGAFKSR